MKTALVQMKLEKSKKQNLIKALELIKRASEADLVVLPEMLMGAKSTECSLSDMAEEVPEGDFAGALKEAAAKYSTAVCGCLWEKSGTEKVYNTAVVFDKNGELLAKYRKLHLFDALSVKESDTMLKGSELPPVFEIEGVRTGLSICYDLRFPEIYRSMAHRGAELFLVPSAWYSGDMKIYHLHTLLAARAIENTSYAACADVAGGSFCGHSAAFGPFGEKLGSLEDEEGVLFFEYDKKHIQCVREKIPCLQNFRSDVLK